MLIIVYNKKRAQSRIYSDALLSRYSKYVHDMWIPTFALCLPFQRCLPPGRAKNAIEMTWHNGKDWRKKCFE